MRSVARAAGCVALLCGLLGLASAEQMETIPLMVGTPHQTNCYVKRGEEPGKTVCIIGGMHGDEVAGYLAARELRKWALVRGTLVLIPDGHVTAIKANKRAYPGNMNTMFPGKATGTMMERGAAAIWAMIKRFHPDLLVTLHESVGFHREDPKRFGQTLTYDFHELTPLFQPVVLAANQNIVDRRNHFSTFVAPYPGCPTYCAYKYLKIPSVTIETCRKLSLQTRLQHQLLLCSILMTRWGLKWEGTLDEAAAPVTKPEVPPTEPEPEMGRMRGHLEHLAEGIGPRPAGSAAEKRALQYAHDYFGTLGYQTRVQDVPLWEGLSSVNVIARWPGGPGEIVLGAHADTVAGSPGANDNASGVALLLELARTLTLQPVRPTVTFVIFCGEEGQYRGGKMVAGTGRWGSRHYVRNLSESERQAIEVAIVPDQVAGPGLRIGDMSRTGDEPAQGCLQAARELGIKAVFATFAGKSDYRPFHDRGVPVVSFDCGDDPRQHTARDVVAALDQSKLRDTYRIVERYLERFR